MSSRNGVRLVNIDELTRQQEPRSHQIQCSPQHDHISLQHQRGLDNYEQLKGQHMSQLYQKYQQETQQSQKQLLGQNQGSSSYEDLIANINVQTKINLTNIIHPGANLHQVKCLECTFIR